MPRRHHQRGVALITVMLLIAIATTAATAIMSRQQLDIRRSQNTLFYGQTSQIGMGLEHSLYEFLFNDRQQGIVDSLGEDWAKATNYGREIEGGRYTGSMIDLDRRFNINSLLQSGNAGKLAQQRFRNLLDHLNIDVEISNAVIDWIDADNTPRFPGGAEEDYYASLTPPYRASNQPMSSPSELLLVKGMTTDNYTLLKDQVTTLPQGATININTASAEVLSSLHESLFPADFTAIINARDKTPYNDVNSFLAEDVFAGKGIDASGLDVRSTYFYITGEIDIGHLRRRYNFLIERDPRGQSRTLMRSEGEL